MRCELIDHMGSDLTVVNAARVSFDKASQGYLTPDPGNAVTLTLQDNDARLINYLARHEHWTPFAHCQVTLRETVPIFVARQRFKHNVGFAYNEISRRYVSSNPEFYEPLVWRQRAEDKKQGSSNDLVDLERFDASKTLPDRLNQIALETYRELLRLGVAPEQARMVLPQSCYTSYYVTGSLAAFARAFSLRSHMTSQAEIQELATLWSSLIQPLFPYSWQALSEYS